jgi:hypothetical protein
MRKEKKHIETIRRNKFSITGGSSATSQIRWSNPLTSDLHNAVENLSAQLYAKDVHFLMELIQVYFLFFFPSLCALAFVLYGRHFKSLIMNIF